MLPSYHPYCHQAALSSEWYGTDLPSFLAKIEACVVDMAGAGAAHVVGGGVSYADVCIWSLLREGSEEDLALVAEVSH